MTILLMSKYPLKLLIIVFIILIAFLAYQNKDNILDVKKETISSSLLDSKNSNDKINITILLDMTSQHKELSNSAVKGAKLALKKINNQNINLTELDSTQVEDIKKESILIGGVSEESTRNTLQKVKDNLFLYLSDGEVFTCLNEKNNNKKIWGLGISNVMFLEPLLITLADSYKDINKSFNIFLYTNYPELNYLDYVEETLDSLDFKLAKRNFVDTRITNLYDTIRDIFTYEPELLVFKNDQEAMYNFLEATKKLSIQSEMQMASLDILNTENLNDLTNGIWTALSYSADLRNKENKEFIKLWDSQYPNSRPSSMAVKAYNAVNLINKAIIESKSYNISKIEKSLAGLSFQAPQGEITLSKENQLLIQPLFISKVNNKKFDKVKYIGEVSNPKYDGCLMD